MVHRLTLLPYNTMGARHPHTSEINSPFNYTLWHTRNGNSMWVEHMLRYMCTGPETKHVLIFARKEILTF